MDLKDMPQGALLVEDDHIFQDNTIGSLLIGFRSIVVKDI